jgi:hypothetical protein
LIIGDMLTPLVRHHPIFENGTASSASSTKTTFGWFYYFQNPVIFQYDTKPQNTSMETI